MEKLSMEQLNRKSVDQFKKAAKTPLVVVLDNIRSLHNVGSVFRTADAFLLEGIRLCGFTGTPPHRDIRKTALGATETVSWQYCPTAAEAVAGLRAEGYQVWGVEQVAGSVKLQDFVPGEAAPLALVFGNEVTGVGQDVLELVDGCIEIPQSGMKHSLNVSVSAAIVVWDIYSKLYFHS